MNLQRPKSATQRMFFPLTGSAVAEQPVDLCSLTWSKHQGKRAIHWLFMWHYCRLVASWSDHCRIFIQGSAKNGPGKEKHVQWAAVVWRNMPCWCQGSEENDHWLTGWRPEKGNCNWNRRSQGYSQGQVVYYTLYLEQCSTRIRVTLLRIQYCRVGLTEYPVRVSAGVRSFQLWNSLLSSV